MHELGRSNPRLKELRRRVRERPPGEVVVDGRRLVVDLVRWGVPILELYLARSVVDEPAAVAAARVAAAVWLVDDGVLEQVAPTHSPQGLLAVVDEPAPGVSRGDERVALYLDGVQDPGNLGAIVRAAAALGAGRVQLSPGCADPWHPAAVRGAAGAGFRLPPERGVAAAAAARRVLEAGGEVWATGAGGTPIERWRPAAPVLLLLGTEGAGLPPATAALAGGRVTVPLERGIESLNVATAAALLLQHLRGLRAPL